MSWQRPVLNGILRWTERPVMTFLRSPRAQRANLAFKAWLSFHPPRGCHFEEIQLGGVPCLKVTPAEPAAGRQILYLHGGAFVMGSPRTHRALAASIATRTGAVIYVPEYRLAPENPFPAAPDDCLTCYRTLCAQGLCPAIGGDSAGGGLTITLLADILRQGLDAPRAAFAFSPVVDLSYSAPSITANAARDVVLPASRTGDVREHYLGTGDPRDPRASPLFAEFPAPPPVAIWVGDTEILLDDARGIAARIGGPDAGVTLKVEHDLPHVWPLFHNWLPEARMTLDQLAAWLSPHWPRQGES